MNLEDYTTEQLKAELKRRAALRRDQVAKERNSAATCRNCKHYCTINRGGHAIDPNVVTKWMSHCCPFAPYKNNGTRFRSLLGHESCEHFERK